MKQDHKKGSPVDHQAAIKTATDALNRIIAVLPQGYTATNTLAVMKEPNPNPHHEPAVWTSWVKDSEGDRYLAVLKGSLDENIKCNRVKIIPEQFARFKNV